MTMTLEGLTAWWSSNEPMDMEEVETSHFGQDFLQTSPCKQGAPPQKAGWRKTSLRLIWDVLLHENL